MTSVPGADTAVRIDQASAALSGPRRSAGGKRKAYGKIAKRGILWSFFREGVSESITTPTAIIMARLLSPFDFGIAASAGFFITLATRLTNLGFNQALVRVKHLKPEHCSSVFVVQMVAGIAAYVILASTSGLMAAFFRAPAIAQVMPIVALTFLITPIGTVPAALMSRNMQFRRTAVTDWAGGLGEAVSAVAFAWSGYGYWSLVYGKLFGAALTSGSKVLLGGWRPSLRFSREALGELFSFGSGVFAKRLLDYGSKNLDNVIVGRVLGMASLGFYDKAYVTVNKVLIRINTGGPVVSFRIFSLIYEEPERFRKAYSKVLLAAALVSFPLLAGLAAAGPDLVIVMYGQRWAPAVIPFQILCAAAALKILNEYAGSAAQAFGRIWRQVSRQLAYTTLVVIFVASFSRWGLVGAAIGVLLADTLMTVLMNGLLIRLSSLSTADLVRPQLPGAIAAAAVGLTVLAVRMGLHGLGDRTHWHLLLAEFLAAAVVYAGFLKVTPFRDVRRLLEDTADDLSAPLRRVVRLLT